MGHIISEEGVSVDLKKIEAIMNWPTPKNVKNLRSFMGLVGYYRRLIEGFSKVAHPVTSLQKKGIKFEWTNKYEESFQLLKELLTSAPILKIVDPKRDLVCTYTFKHGLGEVLTQENYMLFYESRKLKEHANNYSTHELELLAIVHDLNMWRHYLMGRKFELRT